MAENSWNNAPHLLQIAASQQGGNRGAQLWGVTEDYTLISCWQVSPGGEWSPWSTGNWIGAPNVAQIAACQQNDGRVQVWAVDDQQQLWTAWQTSPGGNWEGWAGPNWNGAPILTTIAASQQGGTRGAQLWGLTDEDQLVSTFQVSPGGGWSSWSAGSWLNAPPAVDVAAAQQNDGRVQVWILDEKQQLWTAWQTSPGGDWGAWAGPNWNGAALLQGIAAVQQGGPRGAQLFGIDQNDALDTTYQETPGGNWSGWFGPNWNGAPNVNDVAGAQQNNGCVQLWALDMDLNLTSCAQTSPGGNWTSWSP